MEADIPLKIKAEVARIRSVSSLIADILKNVSSIIKPGISSSEISEFCCARMKEYRIEPAIEGIDGFPGKICVSVNHIAAHGIPGEYVLQDGDILTVDIAGKLNGWHGDAAWTYIAGNGSPSARRLLRASWQAAMAGIQAACPGNRLGDIGYAIHETAKRYGCNVIANCVGHGIGRALHEEPLVMHTGEAHTDRPIVPGMVFTVEPVLTLGSGEIEKLMNNHELLSRDKALCAQFEHTVAVSSNGPEILTGKSFNSEKYLDFPPYF